MDVGIVTAQRALTLGELHLDLLRLVLKLRLGAETLLLPLSLLGQVIVSGSVRSIDKPLGPPNQEGGLDLSTEVVQNTNGITGLTTIVVLDRIRGILVRHIHRTIRGILDSDI